MTVPDAIYKQTGDYHEFYKKADVSDIRQPPNCLEVYLRPDHVSFYTQNKDGYALDLNLNDARILRDVLTEYIARQDRKPA